MLGRELDGRYRVLQKLGEGGWGDVFLVEHLGLRRKEALKVLHAELGETPETLARFRREARALNRLQHPNIVGVYDFGRLPDGRFYLTTEYAEGERLDRVLRRLGKLPVPRALRLLSQLADAVHHAHERGVLHRDLKPQNLILLDGVHAPDFLKVLDFGIGKIVDPEYSETVQPTADGELFGTPAYISPEVTRGEGNDPRSDLYSLGCVAFELLTGKIPFSGRLMEVLRAHASVPPEAPSAHNPDVPPELERAVLRCLEKQPESRFQSGAELAAVLRSVPGFPRERTPTGWRIRRAADPEFDPESTVETEGAGAAFEKTEQVPDPGAVDAERARSRLHAAIHELAAALADQGCRDVSMVVGLADVRALERELHGIDREMAELESRGEREEQRLRELEASIRFALGELRFDRDQAHHLGQPPPSDVDEQIEVLGRRLLEVAQEAERVRAGILDRAITLTAERADREESLLELYAGLETPIAEALERSSWPAPIGDLAARWRESRALYDRARERIERRGR